MRSIIAILSIATFGVACGTVTEKSSTDGGGQPAIDAGGNVAIDAAGIDATPACTSDFDNDDAHCGECDNACTSDRVCVEGSCQLVADVAAVNVLSSWLDVTGWVTETAAPIAMSLAPVPSNRVTYECRTGPISLVGSDTWAACDGGAGQTASHSPSPAGGTDQGSYQTQVRIRIGPKVGPVHTYDFYVHRSLDEVQRCPADYTNAIIFSAAQAALDTTTPFSTAIQLDNPFVELTFEAVAYASGMLDGWASKPATQATDILSLRRQFIMDPTGKMLMIHRRYESRQARRDQNIHRCTSGFRFGVGDSRSTGPSRQKVGCTYFVLNSKGAGVCLVPKPGDATQLIARLQTRLGWLKIQRYGAFSWKGRAACPSCPSWRLTLPD